MSRATRDSAAVRALLARVDSRSTGKLTVGAGAVEVAVHLLRGDVVAVTAADDDRQCIRMLLSTGVLDASQADVYDAMIESGDDVFSALLVFGQAFDDVLSGRFRQNLCDYLSSVSAPRFFEQRGVFVANIQMGHDTRRLLDELCAQCDMARLVDVDNLVVRGETEPIDLMARNVAAQVGAEPRTISSLLHELPLEPTRARVVVGQLVASGVLEIPGEVELPPSEEMTTALPPVREDTQSLPTFSGGPSFPTFSGGPSLPPSSGSQSLPPFLVAPPPVPIHLVDSTADPAFDDRPDAELGRDLDPISIFEDELEPADDEEAEAFEEAEPEPLEEEEEQQEDEVEIIEPDQNETPARPPIHRFGRKPVEDEDEDEDDARTEQVDRRTLTSLLWSNNPSGAPGAPGSPGAGALGATGSPGAGQPGAWPPGAGGTHSLSGPPAPPSASHGNGFSPTGSLPSRGSPMPPPSRMMSPPPSPQTSPPPSWITPPPVPRGATPMRPVRDPSARPPSPGTSGAPPVPPRSPGSSSARLSSSTAPSSRTPPPAPTTAASPRSLADWLNRTDAVDEDELDFFEDHDQVSRGGEADGQFQTRRADLEKIEIGRGDEESEPSEELEALEAPAVKYGAPVLSQVDAAAKVEVANEVLAFISQAFDEAEGPGRGRALMQLLVDGVPSQFSALLYDLKVADGGELPADHLLRNLNARPATEHRQLLNNSLVDIIERALSSAADELPEEAFDEVFGAVAGYRQRMGL